MLRRSDSFNREVNSSPEKKMKTKSLRVLIEPGQDTSGDSSIRMMVTAAPSIHQEVVHRLLVVPLSSGQAGVPRWARGGGPGRALSRLSRAPRTSTSGGRPPLAATVSRERRR